MKDSIENITNISGRIKKFIDYQGISLNKFSKDIASNSYFNKLIKDNRTIGSDILEKILRKYPNLNSNWLITGEGEMLKPESNVLQEPLGDYQRRPKAQRPRKGIPLYDLPVSAGDHFNISGDLNAIKGYIEIPGVKCEAYFPIVGSSMEPLVESGNWIGVNQIDIANDNPIINPTKIFFIITSDERMIKHIEYHQNDNHITCISPNYSPFKVPVNDIKALYRVDVVIKFP